MRLQAYPVIDEQACPKHGDNQQQEAQSRIRWKHKWVQPGATGTHLYIVYHIFSLLKSQPESGFLRWHRPANELYHREVCVGELFRKPVGAPAHAVRI